jgi:hypothetical protein
VGAAALPGGAGQVRRDRFPQAGVGVGGDEADPAQAAGDEVGEELVPRRPGLRRGHSHAQDLAVAVAVDAGGQQHHGVHHAAAFADLHRQRDGGDEGERPGRVERAVPELRNGLVQVGGHPGDLRLRERVDAESMPRVFTSLSIRRVETPAR